ncbi:MAG: PilZ domain-containing protein [Novosphingobium sp.]
MSDSIETMGIQLRRSERIAFDMMVKYRLWGFRGTIMLKDMTPFGARVEGLSDVRMGDAITLLLPGLQLKLSTVVWQEGSSAGVEFDHPLHGEVFRQLVKDYARSRPSFEPIPVPMPVPIPGPMPMRTAA